MNKVKIVVPAHARLRMLERWHTDDDEKLTEVLKCGEVFARRGNEYLFSYRGLYAVLCRKKNYWVVMTVSAESPPVSWLFTKYNPKPSPFSKNIEIIKNLRRERP